MLVALSFGFVSGMREWTEVEQSFAFFLASLTLYVPSPPHLTQVKPDNIILELLLN